MSPIEVITSVERRRRWTAEQKRTIVEGTEQTGNSISSVARKYDIHPNQLLKWRRFIELGSLLAAGSEEAVVKELKAKIRELERILGKKTMEVEILKDAIEIAREKKLILRPPLPKKDDTP